MAQRKMPQVRQYMTKAPECVEESTPLRDAWEKMKEEKIRHLPVKKNGKVVGILSERNATAALLSKGGNSFLVKEIMIPEPFIVSPHQELDFVVDKMADEKYGCAIVEEVDGQPVGIFTTTDACRALREVLETFYQ